MERSGEAYEKTRITLENTNRNGTRINFRVYYATN